MIMDYKCDGPPGMEPRHWTGKIRLLKGTDPYEVEASARGSEFHIICGSHRYGNYLCVPNWDIGMELSELDDILWNKGKHMQSCPGLSAVDAISIADAIAAIGKYIS